MSDRVIAFDELTSEEQKLIELAWEATKKSYCPYSEFPVGTAVLSSDGRIFSGCNVENAAWAGICAERVAVCKAVSEGSRQFVALALVCAKKQACWPCGVCRQFISEFGLEMVVLNVVDKSNAVIKKSLAELLPDSFGPQSL